MKARHLYKISADLQDVVRQVEAKTGILVDFLTVDDEFISEFPVMGRGLAMLDIDPDKGRISIRLRESEVAPHVVCHEIIHLRRNIIEACPKMFPKVDCDPEWVGEILSIENDLEHFFIIREEISRFPEAKDFWILQYRERLARSNISKMEAIMYWCLLRTLFFEHSEDLVKSCASCVMNFNDPDLVRFANNLQVELSQAFPDKIKMIDIYLEFFPSIRDYLITGRFCVEHGMLLAKPCDY